MKNSKMLYVLIGIIILLSVVIINFFNLINFGEDEELIYFVSKTSSENSTFWHSVERGVGVAADELGVELIFIGPEKESDLDHQVRLVEEGILLHPTAIILASSDFTYLSEVSRKVIKNDIIFITVDSDVDIADKHSFIATNNFKAAKQLGEEMVRLLDGEGLVGIISHLEGTTSSSSRIEGFREGLKASQQIECIDNIEYSNNDASIAYEKTLLLMKTHPDIKGFFGTNEATLIGIAEAIDDLSLKGKVYIVGFDISAIAASYIEKDVIQSIVVQRPFNMGYLSVMEAYRLSTTSGVPANIDVDIVIINKENLFNEENQKFLIPYLE